MNQCITGAKDDERCLYTVHKFLYVEQRAHCSNNSFVILIKWMRRFCKHASSSQLLHCWPEVQLPLRICRFSRFPTGV